MQVGTNTVISFHYQLFNEAGEEVESSTEDKPTAFLFGAGNVFPALEQAMKDKSAGDKLEVALEPHQAFGVHKPNQQRVPAKYLKHEGKLSPGKVVRIDSNRGVQTGTVVKVGKFNVDVDMNHPLAGQKVRFNVTINNVREATPEEISHGHAHGIGGHQH